MREITIQREIINFEALDAALRAELGEQLVGISTGPSGVTVYLTDNVTDEQEAEARDIVEDHDPTQLTSEQQAEIDRQQQLQQARDDNAEPLPLDNYAAEPSLIQELAQRIAWLELEIADLRR